MLTAQNMLFVVICLVALECGVMAQTTAPVRAPARAPTPSRLPTLPNGCPYNYTIQPGDTYCVISTKVGISTARLQAANPRVALADVKPGSQFRIPCKPQQNCCPDYIAAAAQGTGLGDILNTRPDLTIQQLLAANTNNPNVSASFVACGTEIRIPCRAGSPVCTGASYAPAAAPRRAPVPSPTRRPPPPPTAPRVMAPTLSVIG